MKSFPSIPALRNQSSLIAKLGRRVRRNAPDALLRGLAASMALLALFGFNPQALAAVETWNGTTDANWATGTDWSGSTAPGTGDTATFNNAGNGNTTISLGAGVTVANILFASSAAAYTIGSGSPNSQVLTLNDGGSVTLNSTDASNQLFNASLTLGTDSTAASYTFTNNSTDSLTFAGTITGNSSSALETLKVAGTGNTTISGVVSGATAADMALTKSGSGTLYITAVDTYTGATTVNGGTLNIGNGGGTGALSSSSALVLGGGTLSFTKTSNSLTQTFNGTTLNAGANGITASSSATPTIALGSITVNAGGTVEFIGPATSTAAGSGTTLQAATGAITTTGGTGTLGLLLGGGNAYATVGLYDWATTDTTGGSAGTTVIGGSQVTGFYSTAQGGSNTAVNWNVTASSSSSGSNTGAPSGTLRFNTAAAVTFTVASQKNFGVAGILVTPNVGANNVNFLSSSNGDGLNHASSNNLNIFQNNTAGELIFNTTNWYNILGSGGYVQSGLGTVYLNSAAGNDYSGANYLNGGVTEIAANGNAEPQLGAAAAPAVNINGGTLVANYTGGLTNEAGSTNFTVALGNNGGGVGATAGNVLTLGGVVSGAAGTGALVIGVPASGANSSTIGLLPGTGTGTANTTAVYSSGTVILSNASNTYTGGTLIESGTLEFAGSGSSASTAVFGTGAITLNGGAFQWASGNTTDISAFSGGLGFGSNGGNLDTNGNGITLANAVGNNSTGGFTVIGSGSLTMNGANTFTGPVTVKSGAALAFGGANVYTGATSVNGSLTLKQGSSLANTAITVGSGGTLTAAPTGGGSIAVGTTGASLTLSAGSTLALTALDADATDTLTLNGAGGTTLSVGGATFATLDFELGSNGSNELIINNGTTTFGAQGGKIAVSDLDANVPLGSYTLISDPNGGISTGTSVGSDFSLATTSILVNGTTYVLSLGGSTTTLTLTVSAASLNYYFTGGSTSSWNNIAGNFATDNTGLTPQSGSLGSTSNVFLTADTATSNYTTETVDGNTTINSLTFTGTDSAVGNTPAATAGITLISGTATAPLVIEAANAFSDTNGKTYSNTGVVVQVGSAAQIIGANIDLGQTQTWEIDGTQLTVNGAIADAPSTTLDGLVKIGTGTLVLGGANTYDGGTTINVGTVKLASGGSLASTGALTVQGMGTFDLGGNNQSIGVLSDGSVNTGTITSSSGTPTLTIASGAFSGTISGSLALTENGSSTLTLSGANSYTGLTTVSSGTLIVSTNSALGSSSSSTGGLSLAASGATAKFTSATPSIASLSGVTGSSLVLGSALGSGTATTLTVTGAGAGSWTTFAGVISNASTTGYGNLTLSGGSLTLGAANTFTGTTLISGGTLTIGTPLALQSSTVNLGGGTLSFGSQTTATFGGLTGSGNLSLGTVALTLGGNNTTNTYSGSLTGSSSVSVLGTGAQTWSNYNGTGSLTVGVATVGGGSNPTLTISGGTYGAAGATLTIAQAGGMVLDINGGTATFGTVNIATLGGESYAEMEITGGSTNFTTVNFGSTGNTAGELLINNPGAGTEALGNVILNRDNGGAGTGLIIESGTVTATSVTLAENAHSADLAISGGSLTIGTSASTGAFKVGTTGNPNNLTVTGGSLTYLGTDGLLMSPGASTTSAASFTGATTDVTLTGVTLNSGNSAGASSTLTVGSGATLYLGSVGLVENPGTTVTSSFGTVTIGAFASWSSTALISLTGTTTFQAADASSVAHNITLNGALTGTGGLKATGGGVLALTALSSYGGTTTVNSGGTLIVSGTLSGTSSVANNGNLEVDGAVNGAATVALTTGAILSGTGSVGTITTAGGTVAPGLSSVSPVAAGTLTASGSVTLDPTSTFSIRLGVQSEADSDALAVGGTITLDDASLLVNVGPTVNDPLLADIGDLYVIINGGAGGTGGSGLGGITDVFGNVDASGAIPTLTENGYVFDVLYGVTPTGGNNYTTGGNDVALQLVAVPEPGTWASLLGGLGTLIVWQRSRRRRA